MFDYQPTLTGDVLTLRPAAASDWEALYAIGSDPQVWAMHPARERYTEANFRAYFEDGLASGGALVAVSRADGAVLGWSRYSDKFADPGEMEIGWTFLGRDYWGGGWNTEMKRLMLTHAFRFVPMVIFRVGDENLRSRRAVEKLGAKLTGKSETALADGKPATHLFYAIGREDFTG